MFSGLSSRCSLYSSSDDYSGAFLTNPTVPKQFLNIKKGPIILGKHVIIGTNSCVLPGCHLGDGVAVGAFSLVNKDIEEFKIAVGIPAVAVKDRKKELINLEKECLE
jgi:galactoside O-acetyltransferase